MRSAVRGWVGRVAPRAPHLSQTDWINFSIFATKRGEAALRGQGMAI
jgi:hypothetical protein